MKRILLASLLSIAAATSSAAVLTFDNISGSSQNNFGGIASYNGFVFSTNLDWVDVVGSQWNFGAYSGDFAMLNNYGGVGVITKQGAADFTFDGLYAQTWADQGARSGSILGFNNGVQVWSATKTINSANYTYFGAMSGKIDELRIDMGNYFLVDNLALNEPASVPEPASMTLLGLGLAGLLAARRRKQA